MRVNYVIDTGAAVSLISHRVLCELHIPLLPYDSLIQGLGSTTAIKILGVCRVYVIFQHVNLEIEFLVVADNVIGNEIDALIGLDVI